MFDITNKYESQRFICKIAGVSQIWDFVPASGVSVKSTVDRMN